jgi:cytochrome c-type biogenesis protein CcmF
LAIAFVTLWGTVYPLISRLINGEEITVARPFYDQVNGPLMLGLVFLMGVGPLLPWRKANLASVRRALTVPVVAAAAVVIVLAVLGLQKEYALAGFGLAVFVGAGILMEWYRGVRARSRNSGENYAWAFLRLVWANRPRYGGYIVHLSVVMVVLGIVGTSFFNTQKDVVLSPGERTVVDDYELVYLGTVETPLGNRTEFSSTVEVYRDGKLLDTISPNRAFYPNFNMASTRAAIRSTPVEDLYVVPSENRADGSVGLRILVNPLIWWMWVAGPVMLLGTLVALWPEPSRVAAPAVSRSPVAAGPSPTAV